MVDLESLRAFRAVADQGSLSRAAALLGVSQSTLSRRISALEAAIGGPLFYRNGRGVVLTELGTVVRPRADGLLVDLDGLLETAREQKASPAGAVDLGLVRAVGRPLPSRLSLKLRQDYPRIRLRLHEAFSGQIEEALATGRVEIGVFNRYGKGRVRDGTLLFRTDMVLVSARDRSRSGWAEIPLDALADLPLAGPLRPNGLTTMLEDVAARRGSELNLALEAGSADIIRDVVSNAGYCTVLPRHVAMNDYGTRAFQVSRIVPAVTQTSWLSLTTRRPISLAARVVARLVREICRELVHDGTWQGPIIKD
jgi:LysR family nitrogen assimilation transcriptional regulator